MRTFVKVLLLGTVLAGWTGVSHAGPVDYLVGKIADLGGVSRKNADLVMGTNSAKRSQKRGSADSGSDSYDGNYMAAEEALASMPVISGGDFSSSGQSAPITNKTASAASPAKTTTAKSKTATPAVTPTTPAISATVDARSEYMPVYLKVPDPNVGLPKGVHYYDPETHGIYSKRGSSYVQTAILDTDGRARPLGRPNNTGFLVINGADKKTQITRAPVTTSPSSSTNAPAKVTAPAPTNATTKAASPVVAPAKPASVPAATTNATTNAPVKVTAPATTSSSSSTNASAKVTVPATTSPSTSTNASAKVTAPATTNATTKAASPVVAPAKPASVPAATTNATTNAPAKVTAPVTTSPSSSTNAPAKVTAPATTSPSTSTNVTVNAPASTATTNARMAHETRKAGSPTPSSNPRANSGGTRGAFIPTNSSANASGTGASSTTAKSGSTTPPETLAPAATPTTPKVANVRPAQSVLTGYDGQLTNAGASAFGFPTEPGAPELAPSGYTLSTPSRRSAPAAAQPAATPAPVPAKAPAATPATPKVANVPSAQNVLTGYDAQLTNAGASAFGFPTIPGAPELAPSGYTLSTPSRNSAPAAAQPAATPAAPAATPSASVQRPQNLVSADLSSSTPLLGVDVRPDGVSRNAVPTMVQSAPASTPASPAKTTTNELTLGPNTATIRSNWLGKDLGTIDLDTGNYQDSKGVWQLVGFQDGFAGNNTYTFQNSKGETKEVKGAVGFWGMKSSTAQNLTQVAGANAQKLGLDSSSAVPAAAPKAGSVAEPSSGSSDGSVTVSRDLGLRGKYDTSLPIKDGKFSGAGVSGHIDEKGNPVVDSVQGLGGIQVKKKEPSAAAAPAASEAAPTPAASTSAAPAQPAAAPVSDAERELGNFLNDFGRQKKSLQERLDSNTSLSSEQRQRLQAMIDSGDSTRMNIAERFLGEKQPVAPTPASSPSSSQESGTPKPASIIITEGGVPKTQSQSAAASAASKTTPEKFGAVYNIDGKYFTEGDLKDVFSSPGKTADGMKKVYSEDSVNQAANITSTVNEAKTRLATLGLGANEKISGDTLNRRYGLEMTSSGLKGTDAYGKTVLDYANTKVANDGLRSQLNSDNYQGALSTIQTDLKKSDSSVHQAVLDSLKRDLSAAGVRKEDLDKLKTIGDVAKMEKQSGLRHPLDDVDQGKRNAAIDRAQSFQGMMDSGTQSTTALESLQQRLIAAGMDKDKVKSMTLTDIATMPEGDRSRLWSGLGDGLDNSAVNAVKRDADALMGYTESSDVRDNQVASQAYLETAGNILKDEGLDKTTVDRLVESGSAEALMNLSKDSHSLFKDDSEKTKAEDLIKKSMDQKRQDEQRDEANKKIALEGVALDDFNKAKASQTQAVKEADDFLKTLQTGATDPLNPLKGTAAPSGTTSIRIPGFLDDAIKGMGGKSVGEALVAKAFEAGMGPREKVNGTNFDALRQAANERVASNADALKGIIADANKELGLSIPSDATANEAAAAIQAKRDEMGFGTRNFTSDDNKADGYLGQLKPMVAAEDLADGLNLIDNPENLKKAEDVNQRNRDADGRVKEAEGNPNMPSTDQDANAVEPSSKPIGANLFDPVRTALMILTPMLAEDHLSLRDDINIKAGDIGPAVGAVDSTALGTDQGEDASRATTVVAGAQLVTQLLQQATVDLNLLSEDVKFDEEATEEKPANVGTTDISSTGGQQESYREERQADTTNDDVAEEDNGDDALSEAKRQEIERRRAELMKQYINAGIQIAEGMNAISSDFFARADQIGKFSEGVQTESAGYGLAQDVGRYVLFETLRGLALSSTQMGVQASRLLFEQEVTDVK